MISKTSNLSILKANSNQNDNLKDFSKLSALIREPNVKSKDDNTVHRRRDLDSLG